MLTENKTSRYFFYAIGEIILVVIGILIALAINNNNEASKTKIKELYYLSAIQSDLQLNVSELKTYITIREKSVDSAETVLGFFNKNKKEIVLDEFNLHNLNVQIWYPFKKNDISYQELINSGNLGIITNVTIKNILIKMQLVFEQISVLESHMQYDFENYIYPIYFKITDLESDIPNYIFQVSKGAEGVRTKLSRAKIELLLSNQKLKNGFVLSVFNNKKLILEYKNMILMTEKLMAIIASELELNK